MKRKLLVPLLAVEAAVCLLLVILRPSSADVFAAVMAFPFEQIGLGLRALSLSGAAGNAVAILLYAAVSLTPCVFLVIRKKRGLHPEDGLLALLSAMLFFVLYLMVNPGLIGSLFGKGDGLPVAKAALGVTVYSVVCAYIVLRILRLFHHGGLEQLYQYMRVMLVLLSLLFVCLIFGPGFGGLLDSFAALRAANTGNEHLLGASYGFLALQFAVDSLPYALDLLVVFSGLALLEQLVADRYAAASVAAAQELSRLCGVALTATVLVNAGFNILQLLFAKALLVVNSSVQMPLFSIAFVLAALLLSRFIAENKALKDDNDSII